MTSTRPRNGWTYRNARAQVLAASNICHLCGEPIDMTLHHYDKMSATVDHIVAVADAPHLVDNPANMRPAHRSCNSRDGALQMHGRKTTTLTTSRDW